MVADPSTSLRLLQEMQPSRLCDLSIQVQGHVFRAHRCVLAASSPYFHDQVLLKNVTTVSLPSVMDPVAFESVLSSAYTGQLSIIHDDIVNYVTVASFLQMWHIVDKCTEILKRPRPPGEAAPAEAAGAGSASRQQSPSSTECLYAEREGRRRDRKPDALPPLATWRRPQQAVRWSRTRPSSEHNPADSQLDGLPGYVERGDPSVCQEEWSSGGAKAGAPGHDGPGQSGRQLGAVLAAEALKQKVRFQQRGAPQGREPPPSPPTPSSSSSVSVSGAAYTGKVHFCHCGKAYTLKSMRDRHVKMQHLNLRPFGCPVCTKSFKMKHHLTKHLKTHGGLRPYECSLCGKKVIWRDSFLRHQARCERLASTNTAARTCQTS
uniref:Zinc finger and BTB domain containing 22a n=1 Tax=Fundulus heteroclitus TaxID=8078 RepID=A0A3Q2PN70_FUNHE